MQHIRNACCVAALLFFAAACSSGTGTSQLPSAVNPAGGPLSSTESALPSMVERGAGASATTQSAQVLTISGTIDSVSTSSLLLKSTACGFINVGYGPATVMTLNGHTLSAGLPVSVTGSGSCSTQITATQITATGSAAAVSIVGTIQSFDATHVLIQGGSSCGLLNVYYNAKTTFSGPALANGNVLIATGAGSCADKLVATQIIVTSPATTTLGGTILAINPNYLLVQTGSSCGMVNIYFGTTTTFSGAAVSLGSTVQAHGTGSCASQLLATTIAVGATGPTPNPTPTGVPTAKPSPTAVPTVKPSPTAVPTVKPSPTPVPTAKPSPTATPSVPTLYVSTTGSDRNSGTSTSPFATIQHATDMARPGMTVSVANGTYVAKAGQSGSTYVVLQSSSGTSAAPITVKAANPGLAIIDGQNYATNYCFGFNTGANYVTVTGFQMQHCGEGGLANNSAGRGNVSSHNIIHDIGQTQSCETTGRNGLFSGDGVVGFTSTGDTIYNIGRLPSSCSQSWLPYTNDHCVYAYGSNVTITNDTIYNCHSGWGVQIGGGSAATDGTGFTITNNTFGPMNNPGGIIGDIVTFTPTGGHAPTGYTVSGNTAQNPNGGSFINNIYYAGAATYTVSNNNASGAANLIDWGGQTPNVGGSGNTPSH